MKGGEDRKIFYYDIGDGDGFSPIAERSTAIAVDPANLLSLFDTNVYGA